MKDEAQIMIIYAQLYSLNTPKKKKKSDPVELKTTFIWIYQNIFELTHIR